MHGSRLLSDAGRAQVDVVHSGQIVGGAGALLGLPGLGQLGDCRTDAFFDLADTIITVRSLIRQAWAIYRWDTRSPRRP